MRISKKIALAMVSAMMAATAWAVQAKRVQTTHTQADGKPVTVTLVGDEFHHGHVTLDGYAVKQAQDGNFYYLNEGKLTSVMAHNEAARSAAEVAYVAQNEVNLTFAAQSSTAKRAPRKVSLKGVTQIPCLGSPHVPIIMVNYQDIKFKSDDPISIFNEHFMTGEKSAFKYFEEQSFGKFTPQYDILGLVELSENRAAYGGNDRGGNDSGIGKMVAEACDSVAGVDWSLYDHDKDGEVDVVIVLYAGPGEAQGAKPETIWPCQWELDASDYGHVLVKGENVINKFAVFNELIGYDDEGTTIDGIGTFCHEFSHCLGLPDFYATNNMGYYGMGAWSIMDYGNYNDNANTPVGYTGYERWYLGWMDIEDAVPNTIMNIKPVKDGGKVYKVANDQDATGCEYLLLECRTQTGWEQFMAGSGLMITHVDYNETVWANNTVNNNGQRQRMTIYPADNKASVYNEEGDLYPNAAGNNLLTDDSTPAARVYTGDGSIKRLHKPITDITRNDDGSITLKFMFTGLKGDVNNDGKVDVADINCIIDVILENVDASQFEGRADVNGDGKVDVADINEVIDIILQ